jgi:hypothetical protein
MKILSTLFGLLLVSSLTYAKPSYHQSQAAFDCTFTEKGVLGCGIGYTICGNSRSELDEIYGELECVVCNNCDEEDNGE